MDNGSKILLTFPSTHYALKAEGIVRAHGLKGRLIPMPRDISSLCGLALELDPEEGDRGVSLLLASGVRLEKKVKIVKQEGCVIWVEVLEEYM